MTIPSEGLGGPGLTYTITPQPLPANMTFNLGTVELVFAPAPGQGGELDFSLSISNGMVSKTVNVPITVTDALSTSTQISGRVVDENGNPLSDVPVTIGSSGAMTDSQGNFTLTDIPSNPGPLSAGGALATAQDRLALVSPVAQLLGHDPYTDRNNVLSQALILPKINWSSAADFALTSTSQSLNLTNAAVPGFDLQLQPTASGITAASTSTASLSLAELPASLSAQHMPPGVTGGMLLVKTTGVDVTKPIQLTLPNSAGYKPGAKMSLLLVNMTTGGHDAVAQMVVSDDGKTMSTTTPVPLKAPKVASDTITAQDNSPGQPLSMCIVTAPDAPSGTPVGTCDGCQPTADGSAAPVGSFPGTQTGTEGPQMALASDAGLSTGEYFQDHQTIAYQSQGMSHSIDLQYSSLQANPIQIVQYELTTPINSETSSITSITGQLTVAGVVQGTPTTYTPPANMADGTTYRIPLGYNGTAIGSGSYPYTITVTETFGTGSSAVTTTSTDQGSINIVNDSTNAVGAGWSIGGLQKKFQPGSSVLTTQGQQGTEEFDPVYNSGQTKVQDLAITTGGTPEVLSNSGSGSFSAASFPSGLGALGIATGDLNGDGRPDLVQVSLLGEVQAFLNNGSGGFTPSWSAGLPSGNDIKGVVIGNFDGHANGIKDIAVLLASDHQHQANGYYFVDVFVGNGDGTFSNTPVNTPAFNPGSDDPNTPDSLAVGDFNGDGMDDLVFASLNSGHVYIMYSTGGGAMTSATALVLPGGNAKGVFATDVNGDGKADLIVEEDSTTSYDSAGPFEMLDLYDQLSSGGLQFVSSYQTPGHADFAVQGLVAGDFQGTSGGLEVAVPLLGDSGEFLAMVPLSSGGVWSMGTLLPMGAEPTRDQVGNIVMGDLNGSGKPSIAMTDGTGWIWTLLSDTASNQLLPTAYAPVSVTGSPGTVLAASELLAVAPFNGTPAVAAWRGPSSDPSTLVHNSNGTATRTYPDGTVIQLSSTGRETSETDRNGNTTSYTYVPSGQNGGGSLQTITDPVGLVTTLTYDSSGHLSQIIDPAGRITTITIDSSGNLTKIVDPDGATTQYGYATPSNHQITSEIDPNGQTATAHYDSLGRLTSETLYDGTSSSHVSGAEESGLVARGGTGPLPLASTFQGTVTDPDGRTTTITLNWMGHPTSVIDATGATTTTKFNRQGFPAVVTDALGRVTTYTYDMNGNVTSITLPDGSVESIVYNDSFGVPTSITDFNRNTTTFTLDSHGNVLRRTDPDGLHEDWTYNSAGQVLTDTSRNGNTTTYGYDAKGRLTTITYPGPGSPQAVYGYDSAGDITSIKDELGRVTTFTYDQAGRVLSEQNPLQAAAGKATSYTYDADGNLLTVTDALGHVTSYSYNARNEVVGMTDPANQGTGRQTTYAYDAAGNMIAISDPLGHQTTYAYDGANREIGTTDADGNRTTYIYDLDGELTSSTDPNGNTTNYLYNSRSELLAETLPYVSASGSSVTTYSYDANGNLAFVTDALNHVTSYSYNSLNQETAVTDALNHTTSYSYDADGNMLTKTDPLGHITSYTYDVRDRLISETQPSGGGTTTYAYDVASELLSVTDADNNVTSYGYDTAGNNTTVTDPLSHVTTYAYDLAGNVTQMTDRDGHVTQYGYDADNRETGEKWVSGGSAVYTMTVTYDAAGRETKVQDNSSQYAYTYDNANRLTLDSDAGTTGLPQVTLTYGYDQTGNRTSLDDSLGGLTSYVYDARNELVTLTQSGTGVNSTRVDFIYDQGGELTALSRYSDLTGSNKVVGTTYSYDQAERLTGITDKTSAGTVVASYAYTLDAANRLSQETRTWNSGTSNDTLTYGYTNNSQLMSVTHTNASFANESFSWDGNGNQTGTGYTTSTGNEQTTSPGWTYTYDADGNMITATQTSSGNVWTYTYDFRNRMTGAVEKNSSGTTLEQATYTYDALDNRIGTNENGTQAWTLYDGSDPIMDFTGSGSLATRYLNGRAGQLVDTVLSRQSASGAVAWYLPDRLGTVRDLIDNSGNIIDHVDYSVFGTLLDESSPSNGDRMMGFAGLTRDTTTGLNLAVERVENPGTGRWTSLDPSGFSAGDTDLYRYVENEPSYMIDPNGLQDKEGLNGGLINWPMRKPVGPARLWPDGPSGTEFSVPDSAGNPITIWGPNPGAPENLQFNCHGLTFGGSTAPGGPFSPEGDSVPTLLKDGYTPIFYKFAQKGDIVIFWEKDPKTGAKTVSHSATLSCLVMNNGKIDLQKTTFNSKNGKEPQGSSTLKELIKLYGDDTGWYRRN